MKKTIYRGISAVLAMILILSMAVTTSFADTSAGDYAGDIQIYSTFSAGDIMPDQYVFKDKWFSEPAEHRNDALALVSMQVQGALYEASKNGSAAGFLKNVGFERTGFERYNSQDSEDACYMWGIKRMKTGSEEVDLIAVHMLSSCGNKDEKRKAWTQDFIVNDGSASGEHYAFSRAADKIIDEIIEKSEWYYPDKMKFWITGQSRGGAVANLLAAKLPSKLGSKCAGIYAYTFESPATADAWTIASSKTDYSYIHNYYGTDDLIASLPGWGMDRYGVGHVLNTGTVDADLMNQLKAIGSKAADADTSEDNVSMMSQLREKFLERMITAVPERKDFSEVRTETVTGNDNKKKTLTYSYQESFSKIIGALFGSDLVGSGGSLDLNDSDIADLLRIVKNSVDPLTVAAVRDVRGEEASSDYWKAAEKLYSQLNLISNFLRLRGKTGIDNSAFDAVDLYAVLKIAGPVVVDTSYVPVGDENTDRAAYLKPLLDVAKATSLILYAHHFDVIIARLHTLANNYEEYKAPVVKKAQPMKVTAVKKTLTASKKTLKKNAVYFARSKYAKVTGNKGTVTYTKTKGNNKITVTKSTGKIKVAKGLGKGSYTVKIKVSAAGNSSYKSGSKTISITVKVK